MDWYDRQGRPITMEEAEPLLIDVAYKRVAVTEIGPYTVSTVWLGLDHNYRGGPPLIFETMVFTSSAWREENMRLPIGHPDREALLDIDCQRYCTEDEAVTGHRQLVELIQAATIVVSLLEEESET